MKAWMFNKQYFPLLYNNFASDMFSTLKLIYTLFSFTMPQILNDELDDKIDLSCRYHPVLSVSMRLGHFKPIKQCI
jgi:hypothetical protein